MNHPALNDPDEFPDDTVLKRQLGVVKPAWDAFMELLEANDPLLAAGWRYYNDGKSWLCKVTHKKTTVCWVAVREKCFSAAFYLNAKAEPLVHVSSLGKSLKDGFFNSGEKLRAIRVEVRKKSDLEAVKELIGIKLQLK
ncbi:MAG: DUF3788 family protein [Candidatus Aminicenantes bacterium]|nr:DUF3788 family protein [Candidatus Aminicenantes bacterium]